MGALVAGLVPFLPFPEDTDTFWRSIPKTSKKLTRASHLQNIRRKITRCFGFFGTKHPTVISSTLDDFCAVSLVLCLLAHFLFLKLFTLPYVAVANSVSLVCMSWLRAGGLGLWAFFKLLQQLT